MKHLLLRILYALGIFAVSARITRQQLRILCYHGIWTGPKPHFGDCLFMSAERFRSRLAFLRQRGYRVHSLEQGVALLRSGRIGPRDVVITIDDAWAGTGEFMLPELERSGFPATLYVTTENVLSQEPVWHVLLGYLLDRMNPQVEVARLLPGRSISEPVPRAELIGALTERLLAVPAGKARQDELREIGRLANVDTDAVLEARAFHLMSPAALRKAHEDGWDLQLHTHTHRMPDCDLERIREELQLNRAALLGIVGDPAKRLVHFCYPGGIHHPSMFALLRQMGIVTATTTEAGLVEARDEPLAMRRILDCESMSQIELEAHLSGLGSLRDRARNALRRLLPRSHAAAVEVAQ